MAETKETEPAAPAPKEPQERIVTTEHRLVVGDDDARIHGDLRHAGAARYDEKDAQGRQAPGRQAARRALLHRLHAEGRRSGRKQRPLTFSFNGGPGSSSVWLHLGILGPQRVATDEMGNAPPPPYALVDNEHTLLTESDLVFIDPVGTGYSRMAEGEKVAEFHEYQRDLDAVGEFIRLYLTRYGRWGSPEVPDRRELRHHARRRAVAAPAGQARHLPQRRDAGLARDRPADAVLRPRQRTAVSAVPADLRGDGLVPPARWRPSCSRSRCARSSPRPRPSPTASTAAALMQGSRLAAPSASTSPAQVARFSGLSAEYVLRCDLRPNEFRYFKELLRHRGQTVGRLDTRFLGLDRDDAGEKPEDRPGARATWSAPTPRHQPRAEGHAEVRQRRALRRARADLGQVEWKDFANKYVNVGDSLRRAMHANPHMRVYVASGYYDLGTPHAAGDYTIAHLGLRDEPAEEHRASATSRPGT